MKEKIDYRLDNYLTQNNYFDSRTKSKQAIERGEVTVDGKVITKPSFIIQNDPVIKIEAPVSFVSLGGYKLDKALNDFKFDVENMICADVGCSTGGFTDCLLQRKAKKVYAIDLNEDILHKKMKDDGRVSFKVKNARYLTKEDFEDKIDLLVADLSFISLSMVIKSFSSIVEENDYMILLIKPQFEVGSKVKFKNGIVKDEKYRIKACEEVYDTSIQNGFTPIDITTAPIVDGKNIEYLILLKKCKDKFNNFNDFYSNIKKYSKNNE